MESRTERKLIHRAYWIAILGVIALSWLTPPWLVGDLRAEADRVEAENIALRARVRWLEKCLEYMKERCPDA